MLIDPYETLVKIQGKKSLISKMESIPVIYDKKYIHKEKESISFLYLRFKNKASDVHVDGKIQYAFNN
jgi:hypothetical protein